MATSNAQDRLRDASQALVGALKDKAVDKAEHGITGLTDRMQDKAGNGGLDLPKPNLSDVGKLLKPGLGKLLPGKGGSNGGSGGSGSKKPTTIIEEIDVGLPVSFVYDQWTTFGAFPSFMKKVENVDAVEDQRLRWKAQIWWSHREWEATILEQLPDERIVWRSEGAKGHVDGAVTFHELTPDLTRVIVVLEYYPQGFFEHTANIWRAQGRRVRVELQQFRRHIMSHAVLDPDQVEGWRGVIEDGEVVEEPEEPEDEYDDGEDDEPDDEDAPEDEYDDEQDDEDEEDDAEDEEDDLEDEDDDLEDEEDDEEEDRA